MASILKILKCVRRKKKSLEHRLSILLSETDTIFADDLNHTPEEPCRRNGEASLSQSKDFEFPTHTGELSGRAVLK